VNGRAVGALGIGVRREYEYSDAETARLLEEAAGLALGGPIAEQR
jgi:hypothetical protein